MLFVSLSLSEHCSRPRMSPLSLIHTSVDTGGKCLKKKKKTDRKQSFLILTWDLGQLYFKTPRKKLCEVCDACSLITCLIKLWSDPLEASKENSGNSLMDLDAMTYSAASHSASTWIWDSFHPLDVGSLHLSLDSQRPCSKMHENLKVCASGLLAVFGKGCTDNPSELI